MTKRAVLSLLLLPLGCVTTSDPATSESTTLGGSTGAGGSTTGASATGTDPSASTSTVDPSASDTSASDASTSDTSASDASSSGADSSGSAPSTTGDPPPDCAAMSDCEACGAVDGCGWCGASGTCSAGDNDGPDAGACSGGWVVEGDFFSCPAANCFAQTNCADCQEAYSGCGWCASTGTCMSGAPDVPAPPAECADQQWYFDICPEDCADEMTCVSCTGTNGCGWCGATGGCAAGTDAGPLVGACAGAWSTEVDACF